MALFFYYQGMPEKESIFQIFKFAYFPKYDDAIKHLAEKLADKEEWDFSDVQTKKY